MCRRSDEQHTPSSEPAWRRRPALSCRGGLCCAPSASRLEAISLWGSVRAAASATRVRLGCASLCARGFAPEGPPRAATRTAPRRDRSLVASLQRVSASSNSLRDLAECSAVVVAVVLAPPHQRRSDITVRDPCLTSSSPSVWRPGLEGSARHTERPRRRGARAWSSGPGASCPRAASPRPSPKGRPCHDRASSAASRLP